MRTKIAGNPNFGKKLSVETRQKMSEGQKRQQQLLKNSHEPN
jgi:hypothetical protein